MQRVGQCRDMMISLVTAVDRSALVDGVGGRVHVRTQVQPQALLEYERREERGGRVKGNRYVAGRLEGTCHGETLK